MPYCEIITKNNKKIEETDNFKWKDYKNQIKQFVFYINNDYKIFLPPDQDSYFYFKTMNFDLNDSVPNIESYTFGFVNKNSKTTFCYKNNNIFTSLS